jgi:hypothetical protein
LGEGVSLAQHRWRLGVIAAEQSSPQAQNFGLTPSRTGRLYQLGGTSE